MAVIVVPTLAPSVNGKICRNVRIPAPASGTASEVVMLLDWTSTVSTRPKTIARPAFLDSTASNAASIRPSTSDFSVTTR